jgi:YaiO family outer membrane protein
MKSNLKTVLTVLLLALCASANAQWLKKTESSDDLYKEAKKEIDLKHYTRAVSLLDQAVDISPKNLDIHLQLGRAFGLAGKIDSARYELNYVIQKNPKYKDAYIYLVNIESVACNYQQAIEYADMGLKYYPNDRDLLLKKLDIYNKQGDWIESTKLADYLFERYSTDAYIRSVYLDYKLTLARQYSHRGYVEISKRAYESVLEQDPLNKEALQAVYSLDVRSGNYESSLAYTNRALQSNPNNYEFLMKKISILDAMGRYAEATEVCEKLMKLNPSNSEVQKLNVYLRMEAGRYYMKTDPYIEFSSVLEKEPANRDALNYVISIATSRGMYQDALNWVNSGLKHYPNDRELLSKKMGILEDMKNYNGASNIAERLYKSSPNATNKQNFVELRTLSAKQFINDQEYDSAVTALKSVLFYDHANVGALNYEINAYTQMKMYDDALNTIDEALTYYPGDESFLFKKAATLEAAQRYTEAAGVSKELMAKYPEKRQYMLGFIEQSLAASRQSMQYDDYSSTVRILEDVLAQDPKNLDALNYIINIESANGQYDSAIMYCEQALQYYPDNRDFKLKESSIYADAGQYGQAVSISGPLHDNYPYNIKYRNTYVDQLCAYGKYFVAEKQSDSALIEFNKALEVAPNDTLPLYYTINLLISRNEYSQALDLIARGRSHYPTNPYFLLKRAQIYENQKNWEMAWRSADTLSRLTPFDAQNLDYAEYLYSHRLKNQIGFSYLHTKIVDSTNVPKVNNVATIEYTRVHSRGTITARINYAGRTIGTGFQFEAETYFNFTPKWYLFAVAAYSPDGIIFPTYRFGLSLGHNFNKGWGAEIGGRYLQADSGTIYSGMAALSKEYKDFFVSLRGYIMDFERPSQDVILPNQTKIYYAGVLTSRYYLNNRKDFFTALMGYGTAPDDFSLAYQLTQLLTYNTVSVGAGYTKTLHYRTTIGLFGTWYNEKIGIGDYRNQYDVYATLLRKF